MKRAIYGSVVHPWKTYTGTNSQILQAAIDAASGGSGDQGGVYIPEGAYDLDVTVTGKGDFRLFGPTGQFSGAVIWAIGDISALSFSNGTRMTMDNLMFWAGGVTRFGPNAPMVKYDAMHFSTIRDVVFAGGDTDDRWGLEILNSDSFRLFNVRFTEFGADSTLISTSGSEVFCTGVHFEGNPNKQPEARFLNGKVNLSQCQIERARVFINWRKTQAFATIGAAESILTMGRKTFGSSVIGFDGNPSGALVLTHPWITLADCYGRNLSCSGVESFKTAQVGIAGAKQALSASASTEYLFAELGFTRHSAMTRQSVIGAFTGATQEALVSWGQDESYVEQEGGNVGAKPQHQALHFCSTPTSCDRLVPIDHDDTNNHVKCWPLVDNLDGRVLNPADGTLLSNWLAGSCTVTQIKPFHTSQNYSHPTLTVSSTGTTLTFSAAADAIVADGVHLYNTTDAAWYRVNSVTGTAGVLEETPTTAFSSDAVVMAWPWVDVVATATPWALQNRNLTFKSGQRYAYFFRYMPDADEINFSIGRMSRGDADFNQEYLPLGAHGSSDADMTYDDGSVIAGGVFEWLEMSEISFGQIGATDSFRLAWVAVFECPA